MGHKYSSLICLFLGIVILSLFSAIPARGEEERDLKVGVIIPLTGLFASGGISFQRSVNVALKQIEEKGGIPGKRILIKVADSEGNVSGARKEALRLILKEKVDFLIGAYLSEETMGVAEVAANYGKIFLIPISASDSITRKVEQNRSRYRFLFRTGYSIQRWGKMIARFVKKGNYSTYAFIGTRIRWNRELRRTLKLILEKRGISETYSDFYSPKYPVIRPLAFKMKRFRPGIVILADPGKNSIEVVKGLISAGYRGPLLSVGGTLADGRVVRELDPPFPLYALTSCYRGSSSLATSYFERFRESYGYFPTGYGDTLPGDALRILVTAVMRAGSLNGEKIIIELEKGGLKGAAGTYFFDKAHQARWGEERRLTGTLIKWKNKEFHVIAPGK